MGDLARQKWTVKVHAALASNCIVEVYPNDECRRCGL
jgi:hypothetical protein